MLWTPEYIEILRERYPSEGAQLTDCLPFSSRQIISKAVKMGIRVSKERKRRTAALNGVLAEHKVNVPAEPFLHVQTPEVAYILGILWADGYLNNKSQSYAVRLEIKTGDALSVLPTFRQTGAWNITERQRPNRQPVTTLSCTGRVLYEHLLSLGYGSRGRVQPCLGLTGIPVELRPLWFRGFFDGDGCLYRNSRHSHNEVSFGGSFQQDWTFLTDLLHQELGLTPTICRRTQRCRNGKVYQSSVVRVTGRPSVTATLRYLYGSHLEIGFPRKREASLGFLGGVAP